MKDRYEGSGRGHSFGATHSGITMSNRQILELLDTSWETYEQCLLRLKAVTGRSGRGIAGAIRGLRRHGLIDWKSDSPIELKRSHKGTDSLCRENSQPDQNRPEEMR